MSLRLLLNRLSVASVIKSQFTHINGSLFICKNVTHRSFATMDLNKISETERVQPKKKTIPKPKITLITPGDNITVTTLEEAQKLSRRRDLKLVKIIDVDTKTERPVYKLMTGTEYLAEDLKRRSERKALKSEAAIKGEKLLSISSRISDHDLESRIRNIEKWISKAYEVRVVINGDAENMSPAENIYCKLESKLPAARFLQKRQKGSDIRFQILPPKRDKTTEKS